MGARGPLAKPVHLSVVGPKDLPGHRLPKPTVKAKPKAPNPPTSLPREAAAEWRRVVGDLEGLGILARVDRAMLTTWCRTWARLVEAEKLLDDRGMIGSGSMGQDVKDPAWEIRGAAVSELVRLAGQLGLSPAARLRMTLPEAADDRDGNDDILD